MTTREALEAAREALKLAVASTSDTFCGHCGNSQKTRCEYCRARLQARDACRTALAAVDAVLAEPEAGMPREGTQEPRQDAAGGEHALAALAGKYNDAPWWDDYLAAIEEYRAEAGEA